MKLIERSSTVALVKIVLVATAEKVTRVAERLLNGPVLVNEIINEIFLNKNRSFCK